MHPCGRCMPCRVNTKRMWTGRIIGESISYKNTSSFLTMTYDEDHKPKDNSLNFKDLQDYLKRLRSGSLGELRYFAVGEYGDKTARPHYHAIIFNAPAETWEDYFQKKWPHGFTKTGEVTPQSAAYCAGYCTKKMTSKDDPRLEGRVPEFSRMSKSPPLGFQTVLKMEAMLYSKHGAKLLASYGDVPGGYRLAGKIYPLGRYWKTWLRGRLGITAPTGNEWEIDDYEEAKRKQEEQEHARKQSEKLWRQRRFTKRAI